MAMNATIAARNSSRCRKPGAVPDGTPAAAASAERERATPTASSRVSAVAEFSCAAVAGRQSPPSCSLAPPRSRRRGPSGRKACRGHGWLIGGDFGVRFVAFGFVAFTLFAGFVSTALASIVATDATLGHARSSAALRPPAAAEALPLPRSCRRRRTFEFSEPRYQQRRPPFHAIKPVEPVAAARCDASTSPAEAFVRGVFVSRTLRCGLSQAWLSDQRAGCTTISTTMERRHQSFGLGMWSPVMVDRVVPDRGRPAKRRVRCQRLIAAISAGVGQQCDDLGHPGASLPLEASHRKIVISARNRHRCECVKSASANLLQVPATNNEWVRLRGHITRRRVWAFCRRLQATATKSKQNGQSGNA